MSKWEIIGYWCGSGLLSTLIYINIIFRKYFSEYSFNKKMGDSTLRYDQSLFIFSLLGSLLGPIIVNLFAIVVVYQNYKHEERTGFYKDYNPKFSIFTIKSIVLDFKLSTPKLSKFEKHIKIDLGIVTILLLNQTIHDVINKQINNKKKIFQIDPTIDENTLLLNIIGGLRSMGVRDINQDLVNYLIKHPKSDVFNKEFCKILNSYIKLKETKDVNSSISS